MVCDFAPLPIDCGPLLMNSRTVYGRQTLTSLKPAYIPNKFQPIMQPANTIFPQFANAGLE